MESGVWARVRVQLVFLPRHETSYQVALVDHVGTGFAYLGPDEVRDPQQPARTQWEDHATVHTDRYDDGALPAQLEAYDRRREARYATPREGQRYLDRYGYADSGYYQGYYRKYYVN